jgi:hypothetical protein
VGDEQRVAQTFRKEDRRGAAKCGRIGPRQVQDPGSVAMIVSSYYPTGAAETSRPREESAVDAA